MKLKGILTFGVVWLLMWPATAQNYTLEQCRQKAEELSPLNRQKLYYESMMQLQESNAGKSNLPQLLLNAQATYQSDVVSLPLSMPGADNPEIPKDQYRASITVQQKVFDGGTVKRNKDIIAASYEANQQQVEVELYQIRALINQIYFGILLQQENEKIILSNKESLSSKLKELESLVDNGVLLKSNLYSVQKQLLSLDQQLIEVRSGRNVLLTMLGKWLEQDVENDAIFEIPSVDKPTSEREINTPQLASFEANIKQIEASKSLRTANNYPKLFAFATGGVGTPNPYNFFEASFSEFYMLGLKLEWNIYDYGRKNNDLKLLDYQSQMVNARKDNYLLLTEIDLVQQSENVTKYQQLLKRDAEILALQKEVINEADAQLKNGVITSTQYLLEVNNQLQAELNAKIHELKLVESQINYLTKSGNL